MGHTAELIFRFRRLKFHLASLRYGEFSLQKFFIPPLPPPRIKRKINDMVVY